MSMSIDKSDFDDDDVRSSWGLLQTMTYKHDANNVQFVELGGLELFTRTYEAFKDTKDQDFIDSSITVVVNVAAVASLRSTLTYEITSKVCAILESPGDPKSKETGVVDEGDMHYVCNCH